MKPTIKCTWKELRENAGLRTADMILVEGLVEYGFDSEIINSMAEFEIFPQTFLIVGAVYVIREEVRKTVNQLLKNEMRVYRDHLTVDRLADSVKAEMERYKVKIEPEDMARIQAGEIKLGEILAEKIEAAKAAEVENGGTD